MKTVETINQLIEETNKKIDEANAEIRYADEKDRREKAIVAGAVFGVVIPVAVATVVKYLRG